MQVVIKMNSEASSEDSFSKLAKHCVRFVDKKFGDWKDFVGIHFVEPNKHPLIYIPHGFKVETMSEKELRDAISTLMQVIVKNHRISKKTDQETIEKHEGQNNEFPFESYRFIIQDFDNRGYVKESHRYESLHGSGRNHWQKTINKKPPLWTQQGAIHLYPIKIKTVQSHQYLMEIQEYCVNISYLALGWLYGKNSNPNFKQWDNTKISQAINYIKQKSSTMFDERITVLLKHMSIILGIQSNVSRSERKIPLMGFVNTMQDVWEDMVEAVFGTGRHSDYNPLAEWVIPQDQDQNKVRNTSPMELDSIRWDYNADGKKICTVIDAKYYKENNLPSTADINKQITYAEWVDKQDKGKHHQVQNVFILPASIRDPFTKEAPLLNMEDMRKWAYYGGYAKMGILENQKLSHHRVHAIYVDSLFLMKQYLQNKKLEQWDLLSLEPS